MKINFAQVSAEDVDMFGDDGLFGPDDNGNFYYNFVEFGTNCGGLEEVAIADGCGRFMPISVEHIPELIKTLAEFYKISTNIKATQLIQEFVESDTEAYATEYEILYQEQPVSGSTSWPFLS